MSALAHPVELLETQGNDWESFHIYALDRLGAAILVIESIEGGANGNVHAYLDALGQRSDKFMVYWICS